MARPKRFCLLDETGTHLDAIQAAFESEADLSDVEAFGQWEQLRDCLRRGQADIVAVNLDDASGLIAVEKLKRLAPDAGIIGISSSSDASFIIQAMRAGCHQFVRAPIDTQDLLQAIQRARPANAQRTHAPRRVCVVGSSGGAGATTIACNLALELAQLTNQRIALVDLNLEYGDVACSFDCTPKYSIADICGEGVQLDQVSLDAVIHELPCNISVIARPENLHDAREVTPDGVDQMFNMLAETFPYVVVDLPRAYSFLSTMAVARASHVLIVTQLGVPFVRNADRIYDAILEMGTDPDHVHIVLNRCNAEFERITVKDVEEHFRRPVFAVIPNDYQFVSASLDLGHPIGADSPASKCRTAIQEMARKMAPEYSDVTESPKQSEGILGKLLGRRPKTPK